MYTITIPVRITIIAKPNGPAVNHPNDFERLARESGTLLGRVDAQSVAYIFEATNGNDAHNVIGLARAEENKK